MGIQNLTFENVTATGHWNRSLLDEGVRAVVDFSMAHALWIKQVIFFNYLINSDFDESFLSCSLGAAKR
jgi:hypothetical protein